MHLDKFMLKGRSLSINGTWKILQSSNFVDFVTSDKPYLKLKRIKCYFQKLRTAVRNKYITKKLQKNTQKRQDKVSLNDINKGNRNKKNN